MREEKGWSQSELGKKMNCVQKSVSRYELEEADLGTEEICKLCRIFRVSADYLLGLEDETGAKNF